MIPRSTQPFILLSSFQPFISGTPGNWVVKSKVASCSGSVALRQLNPSIKMDHKVLCFSYKIICFFTGNREIFRTMSNVMMELFCENSWRLEVVNYFCKNASPETFNWFLDTPQKYRPEPISNPVEYLWCSFFEKIFNG